MICHGNTSPTSYMLSLSSHKTELNTISQNIILHMRTLMPEGDIQDMHNTPYYVMQLLIYAIDTCFWQQRLDITWISPFKPCSTKPNVICGNLFYGCRSVAEPDFSISSGTIYGISFFPHSSKCYDITQAVFGHFIWNGIIWPPNVTRPIEFIHNHRSLF